MKNAAIRLPALSVGAVASAVFALALLPLAGCGSGGGTSSTPAPTPSPSDGPETTRGAYQDLQYTFTVPKHNYALGEVVPMTFTIQNTGTTDRTFRNTVGTFVEASIQNPNGQYLDSIDGTDVTDRKDVTRLLPVYTLFVAAGQTRTFSLQWNQSGYYFTPDPGRTQAPSGSYVLTGKISPENLNETLKDGLPAPPITITIDQTATGGQ